MGTFVPLIIQKPSTQSPIQFFSLSFFFFPVYQLHFLRLTFSIRLAPQLLLATGLHLPTLAKEKVTLFFATASFLNIYLAASSLHCRDHCSTWASLVAEFGLSSGVIQAQ